VAGDEGRRRAIFIFAQVFAAPGIAARSVNKMTLFSK
jgi:hypothetical protein